MVRSPCCEDTGGGLKKGPWTPEEDDKLVKYINKHGHGSWRALPNLAGLNRCGKSCRLRWTNYLRPDIKRGKFSQDEEQTILNLHAILGNKWSAIATHLPGRTDNEIKNFWNTHLKKKLIQMGFDPMTHQPRTDIFSSIPHLIALANLIENPSAWEDRLQAEALQMARINQHLQTILQQHPPVLPHLPLPGPGIPAALPEPDFGLLSQLDDTAAGGGYLQESAPFAHLPELQLPQAELSPAASQWVPPPSFSTAETSLTNTGDACSTSSYGGAQLWSQILDDPLFNEIP